MTEPRPEQQADPQATHEAPGGTPEGHTPERPAADEYGKPGTPAAGLTPDAPHAADAEHTPVSGEDVHAADHAHDDEHEADHGEPPPGPIDWGAWAVSVVGLLAGGVVALVIGQVLAHG